MSELYENRNKGVFMAPKFPVMAVILMVFALICSFIPLAANIGYQGFTAYLYFIAMLLIFVGLVLHKVKMQILTGIGTLILAAYNIYSAVNSVYYMATGYANGWIICDLFISLLAIAAFTVTGLHYVLKKPKPGKSAKLILMIPLACLTLIYMIVRVISLVNYYNPTFILLNFISDLLLYFALMIYTPFREA